MRRRTRVSSILGAGVALVLASCAGTTRAPSEPTPSPASAAGVAPARRGYALSQVSKDVVGTLREDLVVKAYISQGAPPELASVSRFLLDLLEQYRLGSKGKLRLETYDPGADEAAAEAAARCSLRKIPRQLYGSDTTDISPYFVGLCAQYAGREANLPEVERVDGLEYEISALIKRLTQGKRKVAFTTGHGERDLTQGFSALRKGVLAKLDYVTLDPSKAPIGDDVAAIVVGGPDQPFDEKGRREIDAFLMRGKGALFLIDGVTMSTSNTPGSEMEPKKIARPNDSGLGEILERYGFKVNQDVVLDPQNAPGPAERAGRRYVLQRPVFVKAKIEAIQDRSFPVLAQVGGIVFPFGSSVDLVGPLAASKAPPGGRLWTLARTSPAAWRVSGPFSFSASATIEERPGAGPLGLAYAYEGPLASAYPAGAPVRTSRRPVRLVLVGDSDFVADEHVLLARYLPAYTGGAMLVFNAISWIAEDETLAPLRAKPADAGER